jgi:chemotaxis protein CheC
MAENTLDNLNDLQFDVLKEIGNIGAGNATTALAKMMNMKIDMNVPRVDLVPFTNLPDIFGSPEEVLAGILVQLDGDIKGMMMFLVKEKSAHNLVNSLMGGMIQSSDDGFSDMELSALGEIGNIIIGAYLSAMSNLTSLKISSSVPYISIDMAGALLSVPAIEFGKLGDKVLLIETQFGELDFVNGYFLMVPELESYDAILSSLGM